MLCKLVKDPGLILFYKGLFVGKHKILGLVGIFSRLGVT